MVESPETITPSQTVEVSHPQAETSLVHRVRLATHWLWFLVAALEVLLLARIVTMLIFGVTGSMGGTSAPISVLFVVSGVFTDPFDLGVGFLVPLSGLSHAFDVAALLVMDVLFFTTLLITKLALWYARELDTSGEPVTRAAKRLAARAAKILPR